MWESGASTGTAIPGNSSFSMETRPIKSLSARPVGKWNHVVFVRKDQRVLAWLNGHLEINGEIKPTTGQSKDFFLGARSDFFAPLKGALAEFALFGRALNEQDVQDLYNAADPRKSAGED